MTAYMSCRAACICCVFLASAHLAAAYWAPTNDVELGYQLGTSLVLKPGVIYYTLDGFDTTASTVTSMHNQGLYAMCYLSAGSWEEWRPDAGDFPKSLIGNNMADWAGEKWFDIRSDALKPFMTNRVKMCAAKGFDSVEWDNVNAWSNPNTGFPITEDQQVAFSKWLAAETHLYNMSVALKNDQAHASLLVNDFDLAINEECFTFGECGSYADFVAAAKPVYVIQYDDTTETDFQSAVCPSAAALGLHASLAKKVLDPYRFACQYDGTGHPQRPQTGGYQVAINASAFFTVSSQTYVMVGKRLDGASAAMS